MRIDVLDDHHDVVRGLEQYDHEPAVVVVALPRRRLRARGFERQPAVRARLARAAAGPGHVPIDA